MAGLRRVLKICLNQSNSSYLFTRRLLNYTAMSYDGKDDPASAFFNQDVQSHLRSLTRVDYDKVFRRKKLGADKLSDPEYKFMTDAELQHYLQKAEEKVDELLQIPPVVKVRDTRVKVLSRDPALQGLETSRMVFTDITYGIKDFERIVVVREPDGTLQEADWELKQRMNQVYFPTEGKLIKPPRMFEDQYLESLLDRYEYEFVLDRACLQFEPDAPEYQRVVSITYQHINDNNKFDLLRSTRHFGSLTFFLVWNKTIDNLLLEMIETMHAEEARELICLYSKVHGVQFNGKTDLDVIHDYIKKVANKKGALELAVQAYKDVTLHREGMNKGMESA